MGAEHFDRVELLFLASAMKRWEERCREVELELGSKSGLTQYERERVSLMYAALKNDIKALAKTGTVNGESRVMTRAEECFFDPAVRRAAIALRPATNSNPIASRWFSAVFEARGEFSYYLMALEKSLPAE